MRPRAVPGPGGRRRAARTVAVALVAVLVGALWRPGPAAAHGPPNPDSAFYRASVAAITPAVAGVTARVDRYGEWIELTTATATVIVYGYQGEPYLRVTPSGAAENLLSETDYLNRALFAALPTAAAPDVPPRWHAITTTGTVRWHDHRIHWMGDIRPPDVARDPTHPHVVGEWTVSAAADGTPFEIRGTLRWIGRPGGPSGLLWAVIVAGNLPLVAGAVWWSWRRRRDSPGGRRPEAVRVGDR